MIMKVSYLPVGKKRVNIQFRCKAVNLKHVPTFTGLTGWTVFICVLFLQPLRLNVKKVLSSRSDRVKCMCLHPDEPWVLASLFDGKLLVWNIESQVH